MNLSTNNHKIKLFLEFGHTWVDHPLDLTVKIDDRTVHVDLSGEPHVTVNKQISLNGDDHTLKIMITNKNNKNVIVSYPDKRVLKDSFVEVKVVKIDDIDLTHLFLLESKFVNNDKAIIEKPGGLYENGSLEFDFKCPIYSWVLEKLF